MSDKKLTDSEIKKALECCSSDVVCNVGENYITVADILDLINRREAEVETLRNVVEQKHIIRKDGKSPLSLLTAEIKAEAYREFAERLKEKKMQSTMDRRICTFEMIDNLLNELVGDNDGENK